MKHVIDINPELSPVAPKLDVSRQVACAPSAVVGAMGDPSTEADYLWALYQDAQNGLRRVVAFGLACYEVKSRTKHGQFQKWLTDHCPEISYRTASRYMDLTASTVEATGLKIEDVLQKCHAWHFSHGSQILLLPAQELPSDAAEIQQKVFAVVDGKSLRQLAFEFKEEKKPRTYHPPKQMTPEEAEKAERSQAEEFVNIAISDMVRLMDSRLWSLLSRHNQELVEHYRQELGTFIKANSPKAKRS